MGEEVGILLRGEAPFRLLPLQKLTNFGHKCYQLPLRRRTPLPIPPQIPSTGEQCTRIKLSCGPCRSCGWNLIRSSLRLFTIPDVSRTIRSSYVVSVFQWAQATSTLPSTSHTFGTIKRICLPLFLCIIPWPLELSSLRLYGP